MIQQDCFMRREGIIVRVLKNLYKKDKEYGSKIMREIGLSLSSSKIIKEIERLGYIKKVAPDKKQEKRKYYMALTKKGRDILEEYMLIEKKVYGGVK